MVSGDLGRRKGRSVGAADLCEREELVINPWVLCGLLSDRVALLAPSARLGVFTGTGTRAADAPSSPVHRRTCADARRVNHMLEGIRAGRAPRRPHACNALHA
jgi:hypothetical protein